VKRENALPLTSGLA